ncbi:bifunctional metallophosphatase/5'-nucleotidase [bacterium]|nr:bifunctional metallophosphatase/5'-nucleotidase [bacterium]
MNIQSFSAQTISSLSGIAVDYNKGISAEASAKNKAAPQLNDGVCLSGKDDADGKSKDIRNLRFLHLNDLHGAALPEGGKCGIAQAAALVKREQAERPEATLTFNAGDMAEGTMVSYLTKGSVITESLAAMGCDFVTPGNHDFAWGQDTLKAMLDETKATVLCANIEAQPGHEIGQPYALKEVNGVKVGVLGLTVDAAGFTSDDKTEGLRFGDAIAAAGRYLPEMKEEGAEVLVVLSHLGIENDRKLAEACPELDVIIGGHSHTELPEGCRVGNTLIAQCGFKGAYVGEVNLDFDFASKKIVSSQAELIPVDSSVEPDPEVARLIAGPIADAQAKGSEVIGRAEERLTYSHEGCAKLDQIQADSLLERFKDEGAEIAFMHGRSLRANIEAGDVTYENLFNALPHTEDYSVLMDVPGNLIKEAIETRIRSLDRFVPPSPSGFSYKYDLTKPAGSRVTEITLDDGSPLDLNKTYKMATSVAVSDKKMFDNCPKQVKESTQEIFMDYFKAGSPWKNDPDSRVQDVTAK